MTRIQLAGAALAIALGGCAPLLGHLLPGASELEASYPGLAEPLPGPGEHPLSGRKVVIDPGHGGAEWGAVGPKGLKEKDVNLAVARELVKLLRQAGAVAILTREGDTGVAPPGSSLSADLRARSELANQAHADLFLSIHHNATLQMANGRDATEVYYKLEDSGPSYDAASALMRHLQRNLRLPREKLLPGNYAVLRQTSVPAVLGEASYLSQPQTEALLALPEKQRLEAQAYFAGILDYFARGTPIVKAFGQPRQTDPDRPVLVARFQDEIDPASLEMTLDGAPVTPYFDPEDGTVVYEPPFPLGNGPHAATLRARNLQGQHSPTAEYRFEVARDAARVELEAPWESVPTQGPLPVRAWVRDRWGMPVADGTLVHWSCAQGHFAATQTVTRGGWARAYLLDPALRGHVRVEATAGRGQAALDLAGPARPRLHGLVTEGGVPLSEVTVVAVGAHGWRMTHTNPDGVWWLQPALKDLQEIRFLKPGYQPRAYSLREPRFVPVQLASASATLAGQVIALNPEGGPEEPDPVRRRLAPYNYRVAALLRDYLAASGAKVLMTRAPDEDPDDIQRVRLANDQDATLMLTLGHNENGSLATYHYPGSIKGMAIANGTREALLKLLAAPRDGGTQPDSTYTLIQPRCPSVTLSLPSMNEARARLEAYGIWLGLLPKDPRAGALALTVQADLSHPAAGQLVALDGTWYGQTDAQGHWRFERVEPGEHLLTVRTGDRVRSFWLTGLEAGETRRLVLDLSRPQLPDNLSWAPPSHGAVL